MKEVDINKIGKKIFRDFYVSLYDKDLPLEAMTQYERSMYKQTLVIAHMIYNEIKAELEGERE